ncbi:hypothetical protein Acr_18g0011410 [Actinidia rufa]|uniref:Bifunctional inhibitor/plant lipid transfer protein/seed storage helical domain-containing protein n=1 Tax=Actinidia rufa TaxID=165716 RepID=A0A7J0G865_9ERIC|nr:hypothetical protein Acr_18g0011410 [Actinidia rufa]
MGCTKISAVVAVVVAAVVLVVAEGQSSTPSCAQKLVPCANYINSTNPPSSCCEPLREAVTKEMTCLCNLYNTPGLLASFGINITQALLLPGRCKIPGDLNSCVKGQGFEMALGTSVLNYVLAFGFSLNDWELRAINLQIRK